MNIEVGISKCRVSCIIGCTPQERAEVQTVLVDFSYTLGKVEEDDIRSTVDYVEVVAHISVMLRERSYFLLEYAAQEIVEEVLKAFLNIKAVSITLRKTMPIESIGESFATCQTVRKNP